MKTITKSITVLLSNRIFFILGLTAFLLAAPAVWAEEEIHDESELGAALVSGNTNSETYNFKQATSYSWDLNALKASGHYLNARANGVDSARNWDAGLRYERSVSEDLSLFVAHSLESDIFANIIQRNNYDLGTKYFFSRSEETKWFGELGYRYIFTHYAGSGNDTVGHNVRIYSEVSQILNKTATFKLIAEYIRSFSFGEDYQINGEPSLTVLLNKTFSLKTSYSFKYHNIIVAPAVAHLDTLFSMALVAKF